MIQEISDKLWQAEARIAETRLWLWGVVSSKNTVVEQMLLKDLQELRRQDIKALLQEKRYANRQNNMRTSGIPSKVSA